MTPLVAYKLGAYTRVPHITLTFGTGKKILYIKFSYVETTLIYSINANPTTYKHNTHQKEKKYLVQTGFVEIMLVGNYCT